MSGPGYSRAQSRSTRVTAHRPWPLPAGPWVMGQTWEDLLFAHWPFDPAVMRDALPPGLALDTYDGSAWLGITPFRVRALRPRGLPPLLSFAELNVRTYCTAGDRPGIWFFSLDAASLLAVAGARLTYRLPYFPARMRVGRAGSRISYASHRTRGPAASLEAEYEPAGERFSPRPGTLEHFLTERYCLYAVTATRLLRAEIHHPPWPLQPAAALIAVNTMARPAGLDVGSRAPLLHFAARQDVVVWPPRPVRP